MRFRIINNNGRERFVQAKSNAEGEEVGKRLQTVKDMGKIRRFEHLEFDKITPDDILKVDTDAAQE